MRAQAGLMVNDPLITLASLDAIAIARGRTEPRYLRDQGHNLPLQLEVDGPLAIWRDELLGTRFRPPRPLRGPE